MSTQVAYYEAWRDLMRSWGFAVHEAAGWRTRDAEPRTTYLPGLLYIEHHDASTTRSGNWGALNYIINNKLANIVTARDGQITLVSAGVAWHAGVGSRDSLGNIPRNGANPLSLGNEVCNSGSEPYDPRCTRAIIATERAWAIISGREGEWNRIIGHKEWADPPGRKTDPSVNMDQRRRDVAAFVPGGKPAVVNAIPDLPPIVGAIRAAYDRPGVGSYLGAPKMTEASTSGSDADGRYQAFERGYIFWNPKVDNGNAHAVQGAIAGLWDSLGREVFTGFPLTDEMTTPDGVGRYNHFAHPEGMSIYWTPNTGAQLVRGAIRSAWEALGWEQHFGYPVNSETATPDGIGRYNHFTGDRSIYWTPSTGAVPVYGPIRAAWAAQGWEKGDWSYPAAAPREVKGVLVQEFVGGTASVVNGEVRFARAGDADLPADAEDEGTNTLPAEAAPARLRVPAVAGTYRISSGFGPRNGSQHRGIDFASITPGKDYTGADILAAADGVVVEARGADKPGEKGWVNGFGSWVWLRHLIDGKQVDTIYGHMHHSTFAVKTGDTVKAGQKIAEVGNEGDSSGAHLHFEVWVGSRTTGTAVDPADWI